MARKNIVKEETTEAKPAPVVEIFDPAPSSALTDLVTQVNAQYAEDDQPVFLRSDEAVALNIARVQTGILRLDYALGGGVPVGRVIGIHGYKSTFKSTIASVMVAAYQKYCRECLKHRLLCDCRNSYSPMQCVWIDAEGTFDLKWAVAQGILAKHLYLIRTQTAEQAADVGHAVLNSGECDNLTLDSIAAMAPQEELDKSAEDVIVGTHAKLVNSMLRKFVADQNKTGVGTQRKPTVQLINQFRQKIGVIFGSPETLPGGLGQTFVTSVELRMNSPDVTKDKIGPTKEDTPIVAEVKFRCSKNKTASANRSGTFKLFLANHAGRRMGETDDFDTIIQYSQKLGILKGGGSSGLKGWELGALKTKTRTEIMQHLKNNPQELIRLRSDVLSQLLAA